MKRLFIFLFSIFFMSIAAADTSAQKSNQISNQTSNQINDDFIKWRQRPDMKTGANIISMPDMPGTDLKSVTDDWLCLDGSPVSDLHFWGSYPGWVENEPVSPDARPPGVKVFRIQIYSDAPATPQNGYSRPDKLLYEVWVDNFTETYVDSIFLPWQKYEHKYRYDLDLPRMFWQKRDTVYWINISAIPLEVELPWGWETSMDRWNDFAVQGWYDNPDNSQWNLIFHPFTEEFVNMSFELTACKGPIKWLQFPDMANGINIPSSALENEHVVADDWRCTNGKPVTEVHFWGSYLSPEADTHWEQDNPGPPENLLPDPPHPAVFKLSFHKDIPAGVDPDMPWSHPGDLIREVRLDIDRVEKRYWDSVPHTNSDGQIWWEHKYYYIVKLEDQPFDQEEGVIYWLDVGATYTEPGRWRWGWETSMDHWNDNAVVGNDAWWSNLGQWTMNFEDLAFNAQYHVGDVFVTSGIPVFVKPFQYYDGTWTITGNTEVVNGGAGGSGNEMNVNNVNLEFGIPAPVSGGGLLFGEYGGNLNIEINSDFRNFENFDQINGLDIGGVTVSVVNGNGNDMGSITLDGMCSQFAIGGEELYIDNVQSESKIDMAFLLITDDDTPYCKGDFNRDGKVNLIDLDIFAADFGNTDCYNAGDCEGDFTYDGDVDGSDLAAFASEYTRDDCPCAIVFSVQ